MSHRKVEKIMKEKFDGVGPSAETIRQNVAVLNRPGESPIKSGPEGNLPPLKYKALCTAFATKLQILQLNAKSATRDKQIQWLMQMMQCNKQSAYSLWRRIARDTALDLVAGRILLAEERRVKWTTWHNLDLWFGSWEKTLKQLGFLEQDANGNWFIPKHQLRNILNFDETSLSLDGSTMTQGGRSPMVYEDPCLPRVGLATSKTSQTMTMINGSNAWGEALPPHFQFMTNAQNDDDIQIRMESVLFMRNIVGQFGLSEEISCPVLLRANEKGGMDEKEFTNYLGTAIMPLYPAAAPENQNWVILKCDSGPGRMNIELLTDLRESGFILFPGVPNTTAISQETDQNYGLFKGAYNKNLDRVVEKRVEHNKTTSLPAWMVGLIVFGGTDPETGFYLEESAFQAGSSCEACRDTWAKVSAAPLTKACLNNPKVRKSIDDGNGDDEYQFLLNTIQEGNLATHTLASCGYDSTILKDTVLRIERPKIVTEELTAEHWQALKNTTTHGNKFHGTGGCHITSDDVFISAELGSREKEKARLLTHKKNVCGTWKLRNRGSVCWKRRVPTAVNGW
jgi:hypothetical protein